MIIGDIVAHPGRSAVRASVPYFREHENVGFVVANGENAAGGSGITPAICEELFSCGVDVITSGDHIWKKKEIEEYISKSDRLLRPLNYSKGAYGYGSTIVEAKSGIKVAVINVMGRTFMEPIDNPFEASVVEAKRIREVTPVIIVDMHAEATSEKIALSYHLDGLVSAVVGTHTHVQTADETIRANGTAYITDCGMTGPFDGVIGRKKEQILNRFITQVPAKFEIAEGDIRLNGVIVDIDEKTGKAAVIKRVEKKL